MRVSGTPRKVIRRRAAPEQSKQPFDFKKVAELVFTPYMIVLRDWNTSKKTNQFSDLDLLLRYTYSFLIVTSGYMLFGYSVFSLLKAIWS